MTNFTFISHYKNGDTVKLTERVGYDQLNRHGLNGFEVRDNDKMVLFLHLDENESLIYRKRNVMVLGNIEEPVIYLVGKICKKGNEKFQTINYICDWPSKGYEIHQAGVFKDDHPWFYSPSLREYEQ